MSYTISMVSKKKTYIAILFILILAFFAGNFCYPKYFNIGVDFFNSKTKLNFPHFWEKSFKLGLDLQGGIHLIYQADLSNINEDDTATAMESLKDAIERRVNLFGVKEPIVQLQGERLIVELAGISDPAEAVKMIGQTPYLEFKEELSKEERDAIIQSALADQAKDISSDVACQNVAFINQFILAYGIDPCFKPSNLTGKYLKKAKLEYDQTTNEPIISLQFNDEGAKIFEELTARNIGKPLAIYLDYQLTQAPIVQDTISGGNAQITGNFAVEEAKQRVKELNAGALPVPITLISQESVGPTLGKVSLDQSLKAGLLGFLAIFIFLVICYRIPGILASISLVIYVLCLLALFKIIPVTLTLAGIAGFILSMGMAVDANILIFARLREELKENKDYLMALNEGVKRAWPSIRDGNLTVILVGLILFYFGTSFVKGFALTLVVGNLFSMFTALIITNNFLKLFSKNKSPKWMWLWR